MKLEERNEVRTMMNNIIVPLRVEILSQSKLTNISLNNIDSHLEKLNGKVAAHEKLINESLPHTILNCPQNKVIQEIHDVLLSEDAVKKAIREKEEKTIKKTNDTWQKATWIVMGIIAIASIWVNIWFNNRKLNDTQTTIKQEIRNQEGISKVTRGGYVKYNEAGLSDSIKIK